MNWAQAVMLVLTKMKIRKEQEQETRKLGRLRRRPTRKVRWGSSRTWDLNYWRKRSQPGTS